MAGRIVHGHAGRGDELEQLVTSSLEIAVPAGLAYWKTGAPFRGRPAGNGQMLGRFIGNGPLDYAGDVRGRAFWFDAKQTDGRSLPLSSLLPHQVEIVEQAYARGASAAFLVGFMAELPQQFYLLDWGVLSTYWWPYMRRMKGHEKVPASIPLAVFVARAIVMPRRGQFLDMPAALALLDARTMCPT